MVTIETDKFCPVPLVEIGVEVVGGGLFALVAPLAFEALQFPICSDLSDISPERFPFLIVAIPAPRWRILLIID